MENEKTIDILNSLVEINHDRIEGYKTAIEETKDDEQLKESFLKFQQTSYSCNTALVAQVQQLGGIAEDGTKNTGKIHRVWMDFKAMINGNDRKAILSSCVFGDEEAMTIYKDVLEDDREHLSAEQQTMLQTQLALITSDYDKVKMLMEETETIDA
jgi:uncharacterized protein (TIGR02284 family)